MFCLVITSLNLTSCLEIFQFHWNVQQDDLKGPLVTVLTVWAVGSD